MRWISPEKLGASTSKVSTDFLRQNGIEVVNEWYHSAHGVDLFFWHDGSGNTIKFQLCILGLVIEWSHTSGLKTGIIFEEEESNPLNKMSASDLVKFDAEPLSTTLDYSRHILKEIKDLGEKNRAFIFDRLDQKPVVESEGLGLLERFKRLLKRY